MKRFHLFAALLLAVALLSGCQKKSPYIRFGNFLKKAPVSGEIPISHFIAIVDPKSGEPITNLKNENFKVKIGGREVVPDVQPSSNIVRDQLAIAVVVDQGGSKATWDALKDFSNDLLLEIEKSKNKAAIASANGKPAKFSYDNPSKGRAMVKTLAANGSGSSLTYDAIAQVKSIGPLGLEKKTKRAIVAIVAGPASSGSAPDIEPGVPLIIIDVARTNDPKWIALAESHMGQYVALNPNESISTAQRTLKHIQRQLGDLYVLNFRVKPNEMPLRYSLSYSNGSVNESADYYEDFWAAQLAVIAGIAAAIVAIVVVVLLSARRSKRGAQSGPIPVSDSGWSSGDYTIAGGGQQAGGGFGDETTAHAQSKPAANFYGGGSDATSADMGYTPQSSYLSGAHADTDVTSGAMDGVQPTLGSYTPNAGDSTMAELGAVPTAGFSGQAVSGLSLMVERGPATGGQIVATGPMMLGRGDSFVVDSRSARFPGDPRISREHAEIRPASYGGGWILVHRSTTNKTYINESPVDGERNLQPGDRIRIGDTVLRVVEGPGVQGDSTLR